MVLNWVYDQQGHLRYQVQDINKKSRTYGLIGYVDADPTMVRSAYYQTLPNEITVLNPKGINGYSNRLIWKVGRSYSQERSSSYSGRNWSSGNTVCFSGWDLYHR